MEDCLSMYNLLLPNDTKVLREQNVCETKNFEKVKSRKVKELWN